MDHELLVKLMREAKNELDTLVSGLTAADRNALGTPDHWATKDMIAHLGVWQNRLVDEMDRLEGGDPLPDWGDLDATNLEIFEQNWHRSWDEVLADTNRFSEIAIQRTAALSDDVLNTQVSAGRTFARAILGNSFMHWIDHLMNWYLEHGDTANAERLIQLEVRELEAFDPSRAARGVAKYNLACFYAKTHQLEEAVQMLKEALKLRPDLEEWSREDSDLVNLRCLPDYEALYPSKKDK